ncbi:MAG: hypothetical protein ACRCU6_12595, partial [Fusobacteriaceae bacterium]
MSIINKMKPYKPVPPSPTGPQKYYIICRSRLEADTFIYNNAYDKKNAVILTDILNIDFKKITSAGTVFILTNKNTPGWWE